MRGGRDDPGVLDWVLAAAGPARRALPGAAVRLGRRGRRVRRVPRPAGLAEHDGHRHGRPADRCWCWRRAAGPPAGPARRLRGVLPLRLLRRLPADLLADQPRRVRLQPDHQRLLQRPVRLLRHPARRRARPTSCCSRSTARSSTPPAPGRFFIDISFAAFRRSRSAPGRTVTLSGFLLGTVSGSGTATAVSLGRSPGRSCAGPATRASRRAGCSPRPASARSCRLPRSARRRSSSPSTSGALPQVLLWATIPTILYYVGILLAVEIDARRFGAGRSTVATAPVGRCCSASATTSSRSS